MDIYFKIHSAPPYCLTCVVPSDSWRPDPCAISSVLPFSDAAAAEASSVPTWFFASRRSAPGGAYFVARPFLPPNRPPPEHVGTDLLRFVSSPNGFGGGSVSSSAPDEAQIAFFVEELSVCPGSREPRVFSDRLCGRGVPQKRSGSAPSSVRPPPCFRRVFAVFLAERTNFARARVCSGRPRRPVLVGSQKSPSFRPSCFAGFCASRPFFFEAMYVGYRPRAVCPRGLFPPP